MVELQTLITKKVNWAEYNAVLKKLADLRQYVDGMAESVFIGQREALESEFAALLMLRDGNTDAGNGNSLAVL